MFHKTTFSLALTIPAFVLGFCLARAIPGEANVKGQVFELRTYHTNEGKLEALKDRFRNHTMALFEKHGMKNVGYWVPQDAPESQNTLIYILSYDNRAVAQKAWKEFADDPEWKKVVAASEANGKLLNKVDSVFMDSTDFSPIK